MRTLSLALVAAFALTMAACTDQSEVPTEPGTAGVATSADLATPLFSGGGAWDFQVSGGASVFTTHPTLEMTVAAKDQDGVKGQLTYRYSAGAYNRDFHGEATCLHVEETWSFGGMAGAAAIIGGNLWANEGSDPAKPYFQMWIFDNDEGPDQVRFLWSDAVMGCTGELDAFPAVVGDGQFNVRSK